MKEEKLQLVFKYNLDYNFQINVVKNIITTLQSFLSRWTVKN